MIRALLHSADDLFNNEGAWWILALDSILLIPLIFAVFFYPVAILGSVAVLALLTLGGMMLARRMHLGPKTRD
jgi:hypothetical protein